MDSLGDAAPVPTDVALAYDRMAARYAELFLGELERDRYGRRRVATVATRAIAAIGPIADLGCGPGEVVAHLSSLDVKAVGYDLSAGQIAQARAAFPNEVFHVGDLTSLDVADASLGGIVSRYSIIHLHPEQLPDVFAEWRRLLEPRAPLMVSFFGSRSPDAHGTPFDHKVVTAYELCPFVVGAQLTDAGFVDIELDVHPPPDGGRPFDRAAVLGRAPDLDEG